MKAISKLVRLFFAVTVFGCSQPAGLDVEFVIPADFAQDSFTLVIDRQSGHQLTPIGGRHVVEIPPDGVLLIRDAEFLLIWHREIYRYSNGRQVPSSRIEQTTVIGDGVKGKKLNGTSVRTGRDDGARFIYKILPDPQP